MHIPSPFQQRDLGAPLCSALRRGRGVTSQSATVLTQQETFSFFLFALCHCFRLAAGRDRGREREGAVSAGWSQITDRRV